MAVPFTQHCESHAVFPFKKVISGRTTLTRAASVYCGTRHTVSLYQDVEIFQIKKNEVYSKFRIPRQPSGQRGKAKSPEPIFQKVFTLCL